MRIILALLLFIILVSAIIFLQILLSKKDNKWLGFILPAITLLYSIIVVSGLAFYMPATLIAELPYRLNRLLGLVFYMPATLTDLLKGLYIFVLYNIPTAILLGIYYACHLKLKKNKEIEKMTIQDFE